MVDANPYQIPSCMHEYYGSGIKAYTHIYNHHTITSDGWKASIFYNIEYVIPILQIYDQIRVTKHLGLELTSSHSFIFL